MDFFLAEAANACGFRQLSTHHSRHTLQSSGCTVASSHFYQQPRKNVSVQVYGKLTACLLGTRLKTRLQQLRLLSGQPQIDDSTNSRNQYQHDKDGSKHKQTSDQNQEDARNEGAEAPKCLWQLPAGIMYTALLVPCKLEPDFNTNLIKRVCDCVPTGSKEQVNTVVQYALRVKDKLDAEPQPNTRATELRKRNQALLFSFSHDNEIRNYLGSREQAIAVGVARLLGVKATMYEVRELGNARTIVFTGSPERAHAAAYVSGFAITALSNAERNYNGTGKRKVFVPVGTTDLYFSVKETCDDYLEQWTDAVFQGLKIVRPSNPSMEVTSLDRLPGAAVPPYLEHTAALQVALGKP
eukprot:jgi/Chlat1/2448/Chrsp171S02336